MQRWRMGAGALASAIREREVSVREAVEAHLSRIAAVNPAVNAVTTVLEGALDSARRADEVLARGGRVGVLHGVPFTVKEQLDVAGSATTAGMAAGRDRRAPADAPAVALLRAAGAIPIARTNMAELATRWQTDSGVGGTTLNPWMPDRTPGGSSGGDAVAVATGMAPLGLGADYGGSVRYPAQCCGVVGLRPTTGRVP